MVSTVTAHVAFALGLSTDVAVIVALPNPTAVIVPLLTVATEGLLEVQVTDLSVASAGNTVAVKVSVWPSVKSIEVLSNVTLVT